jgi:hypothetical protein
MKHTAAQGRRPREPIEGVQKFWLYPEEISRTSTIETKVTGLFV